MLSAGWTAIKRTVFARHGFYLAIQRKKSNNKENVHVVPTAVVFAKRNTFYPYGFQWGKSLLNMNGIRHSSFAAFPQNVYPSSFIDANTLRYLLPMDISQVPWNATRIHLLFADGTLFSPSRLLFGCSSLSANSPQLAPFCMLAAADSRDCDGDSDTSSTTCCLTNLFLLNIVFSHCRQW